MCPEARRETTAVQLTTATPSTPLRARPPGPSRSGVVVRRRCALTGPGPDDTGHRLRPSPGDRPREVDEQLHERTLETVRHVCTPVQDGEGTQTGARTRRLEEQNGQESEGLKETGTGISPTVLQTVTNPRT